MQGMQTLLLSLLMALAASEVVTPMPSGFYMGHQTNHSTPTAAAVMQEGTKIESWAPSQPEVTQMLSYPTMPNTQPFVPANHYHPGYRFSPSPTNEFRSEHYAYPFEPNYAYPVSQPPIDSALVPTTKHFVIVSFIGLLLLFAIIQNSIASAKHKDALVEVLSNRRKRNAITLPDFEPMTPEVELALKEDARVRCTQRTLCYENRKLLKDFGDFGKVLAKYLTRSVRSSLKETSPGWDRLVEDAADAGLRGEDCDVIYRDCSFDASGDLAAINEEE